MRRVPGACYTQYEAGWNHMYSVGRRGAEMSAVQDVVEYV